MLSIGVRFCGGCNPEIDRSCLVDHLKEAIERRGIRAFFVTDREAATDLILLINGCKHACLEEAYPNDGKDPHILSVRGEMVGDTPVREQDIPEFLAEKIVEVRG